MGIKSKADCYIALRSLLNPEIHRSGDDMAGTFRRCAMLFAVMFRYSVIYGKASDSPVAEGRKDRCGVRRGARGGEMRNLTRDLSVTHVSGMYMQIVGGFRRQVEDVHWQRNQRRLFGESFNSSVLTVH